MIRKSKFFFIASLTVSILISPGLPANSYLAERITPRIARILSVTETDPIVSKLSGLFEKKILVSSGALVCIGFLVDRDAQIVQSVTTRRVNVFLSGMGLNAKAAWNGDEKTSDQLKSEIAEAAVEILETVVDEYKTDPDKTDKNLVKLLALMVEVTANIPLYVARRISTEVGAVPTENYLEAMLKSLEALDEIITRTKGIFAFDTVNEHFKKAFEAGRSGDKEFEELFQSMVSSILNLEASFIFVREHNLGSEAGFYTWELGKIAKFFASTRKSLGITELPSDLDPFKNALRLSRILGLRVER